MITYTHRYSSGYLIPNSSWHDWIIVNKCPLGYLLSAIFTAICYLHCNFHNGEASSEPAHKKARKADIDTEDIIMGEELSDIHINIAQNLLKVQFPEMRGLKSILLQQKEMLVLEMKEKVVQFIHCSIHTLFQLSTLDSCYHHWRWRKLCCCVWYRL